MSCEYKTDIRIFVWHMYLYIQKDVKNITYTKMRPKCIKFFCVYKCIYKCMYKCLYKCIYKCICRVNGYTVYTNEWYTKWMIQRIYTCMHSACKINWHTPNWCTVHRNGHPVYINWCKEYIHEYTCINICVCCVYAWIYGVYIHTCTYIYTYMYKWTYRIYKWIDRMYTCTSCAYKINWCTVYING